MRLTGPNRFQKADQLVAPPTASKVEVFCPVGKARRSRTIVDGLLVHAVDKRED